MGADPSLMEALFQLVTSIQEAHFIHFMDMGAIGTAVYIINYFPTKALAEMTLEEAFTGHNP